MYHLGPETLEPHREQDRSLLNSCLVPRVELDERVKFGWKRIICDRDLDIVGRVAVINVAGGGSCRGDLTPGKTLAGQSITTCICSSHPYPDLTDLAIRQIVVEVGDGRKCIACSI